MASGYWKAIEQALDHPQPDIPTMGCNLHWIANHCAIESQVNPQTCSGRTGCRHQHPWKWQLMDVLTSGSRVACRNGVGVQQVCLAGRWVMQLCWCKQSWMCSMQMARLPQLWRGSC